ncbi:GNAT family N-acetyltransferase [bacterium]|nr:GNAT family N-acetyltransferase [bacterium]
MKVVCHTRFEDIIGLDLFWKSAISEIQSDLYVHYNFFWIKNWIETVYSQDLKNQYQFKILVAYEGDSIIGVLPLMLEVRMRKKIFPYRYMVFIGHGMVDYADFVIPHHCPYETRLRIIDSFLKYLFKHHYGWEEIRFDLIPESSLNLPILTNLLNSKASMTLTQTLNLFIETKGNWQDFIATKGKDITSDVNRRINKLRRSGSFEFRFNEAISFESFFDEIKRIHIKRQDMLKRNSFYQETGTQNFVFNTMLWTKKENILDYCALLLNDKIIAYMFGFRINAVRYSWNVGFDPDFAELSPGKILLFMWIKEAFENPEVNEFNFMRGDADFKRKWTEKNRLTYKLRFKSNNMYQKLISSFHGSRS